MYFGDLEIWMAYSVARVFLSITLHFQAYICKYSCRVQEISIWISLWTLLNCTEFLPYCVWYIVVVYCMWYIVLCVIYCVVCVILCVLCLFEQYFFVCPLCFIYVSFHCCFVQELSIARALGRLEERGRVIKSAKVLHLYHEERDSGSKKPFSTVCVI